MKILCYNENERKRFYMGEKIKYKKCPYCELNYIPITDYCCKVCYANSQIARQEAISQRNKKKEENKKQRDLIKLQELEKEKLQEYNNRENLLTLLDEFGFIGFLHTANFENFINIYKCGFLKSRNQLTNEGVLFEDNAEGSVLEHTDDIIKSKVRFYYRQITPTNISAFVNHNQRNPVMFVFEKKLIFSENVLFCDGCAGSSLTTLTKKAKEALTFNWKSIFSIGPFNSDDFVLKNHRNAEFLIDTPVPIDNANKIYFKNYKDYLKACELFGQDNRFEHNLNLFY